MFGSVVLDVAIGMTFVYLLLSLIASVVQEILSAFMQLRAANLQRGLQSLFSGDSLWGKSLVDSVYSHGLIRGLYSDPCMDARLTKGRLKKAGDAIRTILRKVIGITPTADVNEIDPGESKPDQLLLPSYIPPRTFSLALVDILNTHKLGGSEAMDAIQTSLRDHHWAYRTNKAGQALLALATESQGDLSVFQKRLEDWYSDSMDRASAWYKRYTQRVLLVIGLILAAALNVDSVRVAETMWTDRDVRQAMVDAASKYSSDHPGAPAAQVATPETAQGLKDKLNDRVSAFSDVTKSALLPVGWKRTPLEYWNDRNARQNGWKKKALAALCGWFLTALAISLGAAFWFDLLNKFMVVRSTIKPQEKSQTEASKDKQPATST